MMPKELFGLLALVLTLAAFYPYVRSILPEETRPHVISWFIWAAGTFVVFVAQLLDGGGPGAWVIGVSGLITMGVAKLAWHKSSDTGIDRLDWVFLILALSALPLWILTVTALSAVIILTLVDVLGFGPSVRRAYQSPKEESATFFALGAIRNMFVILALENYTWTTVLFPAAVGIACALFVLMIFARRALIPPR